MSPHQRTVVSFLSPSSAASRIAQEKLANLLGWRAVSASSTTTTSTGQSSSLSSEWNQAALECPNSGNILQWLSVDSKSDRSVNERNPFQLLAIQETSSLLDEATQELQHSLDATSSSTRRTIKRMLWQPVTIRDLLGKDCLPLVQWNEAAEQADQSFVPGSLKEVVIPTYDYAKYSNGCTLREHLSSAPLNRPATGLYQMANGLCLRPIPMGVEDRKLSPPSLVFHAKLENLPWIEEQQGKIFSKRKDFDVFKIGYNGISKGQLMLRSADWLGMDLRFCEQTKYRAAFAEAQEALLASSLPSLQSHHVLDGAQGTIDPKNEKMDCWVEFRESVKNPVGFWSKKSAPRIAKAPDLPYE